MHGNMDGFSLSVLLPMELKQKIYVIPMKMALLCIFCSKVMTMVSTLAIIGEGLS